MLHLLCLGSQVLRQREMSLSPLSCGVIWDLECQALVDGSKMIFALLMILKLSPPCQYLVVLGSAWCYDKLLQWRYQICQSVLGLLGVVTVGDQVSTVRSEQDPDLAGSTDVRPCQAR